MKRFGALFFHHCKHLTASLLRHVFYHVYFRTGGSKKWRGHAPQSEKWRGHRPPPPPPPPRSATYDCTYPYVDFFISSGKFDDCRNKVNLDTLAKACRQDVCGVMSDDDKIDEEDKTPLGRQALCNSLAEVTVKMSGQIWTSRRLARR